jgi:hypothetical protein
MTDQTAKLRLPLIAASQSQKHVTHNVALQELDTLVMPSVKSRTQNVTPGTPAEGDCYIPMATATGAWISWENRLVRYQDGQWITFLPNEGWALWVEDEKIWIAYSGGAWIVLLAASTSQQRLFLGLATVASSGRYSDLVGAPPANSVFVGQATVAVAQTPQKTIISDARIAAGTRLVLQALNPNALTLGVLYGAEILRVKPGAVEVLILAWTIDGKVASLSAARGAVTINYYGV